MALWLELLIAALLILAGLFAIVGSFGLIRLPDPMTRLHAPTKATTLGIGGVLVASMLYSWAAFGRLSAHELLITLFLFLSAPITAAQYSAANVDTSTTTAATRWCRRMPR